MPSDRFYCPSIRLDGPFALEGDEARHLSRVRRVPVGAEVEVFDGRGLAVLARVEQVGRDRVELRAAGRLPAAAPSTAARLTLATAIPKGDRFDWLVEKAPELGVERVVPLATERSTVDPRSAKLDRLRRAVVEASKQCRRDVLMALDDPIGFDRFVAAVAPNARRWIAHPGGAADWAGVPLDAGAEVVAAIGPEGGFTDREVALAEGSGWEPIALTSTILRIETAGLAVAAQVLLRAVVARGGPAS